MQNKNNEDWSELLPEDPKGGDALWDLSSGFGESPDLDVDAAWSSFEQKLETKQTKKSARVRRFGWKRAITAVAAAIALFFVINHFSAEDNVVKYANLDISEKKLVLQDQSEVMLMKGSKIQYEEKDDARMVDLHGEAMFHVTTDSKRPFHVTTPEYELVVVGTAFKASSGSKAGIKVMEGHVRARGRNEADWVDLYAGDVISVNEALVLQPKKSSKEQRSKLQFDEVKLSKVVKDIEAAHNIRLLTPSKLSDCPLTADFSGNTVMEIASTLAVFFNAEMSVDGETVQLKGGRCQ